MLEGFSWLVLDDERVGKVFCVRNRQEYEAYRGGVRGEVIAFCSHQPMGRKILGITEGSATLVRQMLRFVKRELKVSKTLDTLPDQG